MRGSDLHENGPTALDKTEREPDIADDKKSSFFARSFDMPKPPAAVPIQPPHQRIKELAKLPRGKAWASRLCAFEDAIRAQRKAHKSYREIAAWLDTQGLHVSASSVHGFVKARAQRKRPLYALPEPSPAPPTPPTPAAALPSTADTFADPLNFDLEGRPLPGHDPDAENPFKMRKRKPS